MTGKIDRSIGEKERERQRQREKERIMNRKKRVKRYRLTDRLIVRKLERERQRDGEKIGRDKENEIDGAKCDGLRQGQEDIKDRWIHEREEIVIVFWILFSFCRVFYFVFFFIFFFFKYLFLPTGDLFGRRRR